MHIGREGLVLIMLRVYHIRKRTGTKSPLGYTAREGRNGNVTRRIMGFVILLCAALAGCTRETQAAALRLGTTYTVEQSGALALLDSLRPSIPVRVVIASSGQIIHSAAAGNLDVVVTHAPTLEQRLLVDPGHVALRCPFVASRFAIVGPAADPAQTRTAASAAEAFRRIATRRAVFVSRADSSGTHIKELALWSAVGQPSGPRAPWYVQAGVDQIATLRLADERAAYALADLPTFTRLAERGTDLRVLFTADTVLINPYTLYVIRSASEHSGAARFSTWALADWRARLLALRLPDGTAAFAPLAGGCSAPAVAAER
jgi:tungstate transport system substrate-binding protein